MSYRAGAGLQGMLKEGTKTFEGVDEAVIRNIDAATQIASIVSSSTGPNGMKKLVVNHLDKILVTADTATILKELEVQHPAAKLLVLAATMQEQECGDGTNLCVSFAGELLKKAKDLLHTGLHTSEIIAGYEVALKKCLELMPELVCDEVKDLRNKDTIVGVLKSVLCTKYYGYEEQMGGIVADACIAVMPSPPKPAKVGVDAVRVAKIQGGSITDSKVYNGVVLGRSAEGSIKYLENAKIAVYGCGIEASSTETKGTVLIRNADDLLNYNKGEEKLMDNIIRSIADAGINCIVTGGTISEMAMHFCERYKMMIIKIPSKWDLKRVCSAVKASAMARLGPPTPEEMGACDIVEVQELGGRKITVFRQHEVDESARIATCIIRASTANILDDVERAIDDGVNTIRVLSNNPCLIPGAGASEIELATRISKLAQEMTGLEQYATQKFAEALEVVPRTIADSSGQDAEKSISTLYNEHNAGNSNAGIDCESTSSSPLDAVKAGLLDSLEVKMSAIRLAVDAALTVLRVDQIIMSKPAGGPKPGGPGAGPQ